MRKFETFPGKTTISDKRIFAPLFLRVEMHCVDVVVDGNTKKRGAWTLYFVFIRASVEVKAAEKNIK